MKEAIYGMHHRGEFRCGGRGFSDVEDEASQRRGGGPHGHRGWSHHFGGRDPFAGRGGRLFDGGDIKLVILKLLSESPSYGYQLMKRMEEQLAGGYMPSAGVIYPTLTMLEEEGLAVSSTSDGSKRVFTVTPEGQEFLKNNQERISQVVARLKEAGEGFRRRRSPEIMKAFLSLRSAVGARISRETVTQEQIQKIVEAIDTATRTIDGV